MTASTISCPSGTLAEGAHTTKVSVADVYGNVGTGTGNFSVDSTAPAVSSVLPAGAITSSSTTVKANISDAGSGINAATAYVYLDGAARSGCTATATSVSCPVTGLANGTHNISVRVRDNAGNTGTGTGSFSVSVSVDTTAPSVTGITPSGYVTSASTTVYAGFSDAGTGINQSTAVAKIDGTTLSGCAVTASTISCPSGTLAAGAHTITVSVADNAGNAGNGSGSFSMDATAPAVTGITPTGTINTASATISAYYSDAGSGVNTTTAQVKLDGSVLAGCAVTASTISCPSGTLAAGAHTITVSVADNAGNTGTGTGSFTFSNGTDITAPAITSVTPSGTITTDTATIKVNFTETGSGVNKAASSVTLDGTPLSGCTWAASSVSCAVSGLLQGSHTIGGRIVDNAGNAGSISGSFASNLSGKPSLALSTVSSTSSGGKTTVTYRVTNTGSATAYSVKMTANSTTSGVTLATPLPITVASSSIAPGASKTFTATYNGTTPGQTFSTTWSGTAQTVFLLLFRTTYNYSYPMVTVTP